MIKNYHMEIIQFKCKRLIQRQPIIPTKEPLIREIALDAERTESKIIRLIEMFKAKYPSPAVRIVKGDSYRIFLEIDGSALIRQYETKPPHPLHEMK